MTEPPEHRICRQWTEAEEAAFWELYKDTERWRKGDGWLTAMQKTYIRQQAHKYVEPSDDNRELADRFANQAQSHTAAIEELADMLPDGVSETAS